MSSGNWELRGRIRLVSLSGASTPKSRLSVARYPDSTNRERFAGQGYNVLCGITPRWALLRQLCLPAFRARLRLVSTSFNRSLSKPGRPLQLPTKPEACARSSGTQGARLQFLAGRWWSRWESNPRPKNSNDASPTNTSNYTTSQPPRQQHSLPSRNSHRSQRRGRAIPRSAHWA